MKHGVTLFLIFISINILFAQYTSDRWQLVWQDEFNYKGLPDSTKWNYDTRGNEYGWGNNEKQWYNVANLKNTEVSNGTLKIRAFKDSSGNKAYSSGRITTQHKGDWKYCKIEVRAKLPAGRGTWPAIWMLSTDNSYGGWPASGEIDILEHVGFSKDTVFATAHTGDFNHMRNTQVGKKIFLPTATTNFHVYGLEWDENEFRCYVDGNHFFTFKNNGKGPGAWPFDKPFHLILNLAIGGNLGGKKGIDDDVFPHIFEIDYVRVYQKNNVDINSLIAQRKVVDTNLILPPSWSFGLLYGGYTNQKETLDRVQTIRKKNLPIDAYWIDSWFWDYKNKGKGPQKYIDFVADTISYPDRKAMWNKLQNWGVKGGFWVWGCIQKTGNESAFKDFEEKGFFKNVYLNTSSWHNSSTTTAMFENGVKKVATPTGDIDFNNPNAVTYFKSRMKHFFDEGADFIKLDKTSDISESKAMFEMTQEFGKETKGRGFILAHTGGQNSPEYKRYPTKWTDDTRSDWTVENPLIKFDSWVPKVALKENIAMFTDPAQKSSEIPFLTNDLGGFDMGKTDKPEEALYIRWLQFSMFNPITEVFSQPDNPTSNMPWLYSPKSEKIFRDYAHLRMRLFPYIYSSAHLSRIAGIHMIGKIPGQLYQFMFGNSILVAPVYEKDVVERSVFFPEGKWYNFWDGTIVEGGQTKKVEATLDKIPLFVKSGSVIPLRPYSSSIESGNNQKLTLKIFPGDFAEFNLIEDDGISNDYLKGGYASTNINIKSDPTSLKININPLQGKYEGVVKKREWVLELVDSRFPEKVYIGSEKLTWKRNKSGQIVIKIPQVDTDSQTTILISFKKD